MRYFAFLLDLDGEPITDSAMQAYESLPFRRGLAFKWTPAGTGMVLTCGEQLEADAPVARDGEWVAVGNVRLDNRAELEERAGERRPGLNDLEVLLRYVGRRGPKSVSEILGDFSFILWNAATRSGLAARDALGVRRLYYARNRNMLAFGDRAEALALSGAYDVRYLAEAVAGYQPTDGATPYADVSALPAGSIAAIGSRPMKPHRYWSPYDCVPTRTQTEGIASLAEECRHLLGMSVRLRLDGQGATWAQLSGGLDSSSIVSMACWMAERGEIGNTLDGTVTYLDHDGAGADESKYSDAVVKRFHVRNELVADRGMWHDDGDSPPRTDLPCSVYPLYARERAACAVIRSSGGLILLTGNGGDQLFGGNTFFFADWAAQGHLKHAVQEMARRAAVGRISLWDLAYQNMLLPLLPAVIQRRLLHSPGVTEGWIAAGANRRYELHRRRLSAMVYAGRWGLKYGDAIATSVAATRDALYLGVLDDSLEIRHPFLYRPLVEFALRLSPEVNVRPHMRKRVLREAMRTVLPDAVRCRVGKGTLAGPSARSLVNRRALLERLIDDPMLGQLGIIDPPRLRAVFAQLQAAPRQSERLRSAVQHTLGIEAWLRVRSGWWPNMDSAVRKRSSSQPALA